MTARTQREDVDAAAVAAAGDDAVEGCCEQAEVEVVPRQSADAAVGSETEVESTSAAAGLTRVCCCSRRT